MNAPTPQRGRPAKIKESPETEGVLVGYDVTVEGTYWGSDMTGRATERGYTVGIMVPANYNTAGRGSSFIKKVLLGKVTGQPYLKFYKDKDGKMTYADYRQLRTHNIIDWNEVYDSKRAGDIVREKEPQDMSTDELKRALVRLGITYPNPAKKIELINLLEDAKGKQQTEETDDYRPNFGIKGMENVDKNIDDVEPGQPVINSEKDPKNPLLPKETDKFVDSFTT